MPPKAKSRSGIEEFPVERVEGIFYSNVIISHVKDLREMLLDEEEIHRPLFIHYHNRFIIHLGKFFSINGINTALLNNALDNRHLHRIEHRS